MRHIVNLNSSGSASIIIPKPSAPGVLPQHPEAPEYAGVALMVTPDGTILDPDVVRTTFAETSRWLLTCSVVGSGSPLVYKVSGVYQLLSMSDAFQLPSKRDGISVQVARLSTPGRGDIADIEFANQVTIINVHCDPFQSVVDTPCILRPDYDKLEADGSLSARWSFDIPTTDPGSSVSGSLIWLDDGGNRKSIAVTRTDRSSLSMTSHGDILKQLINGDYSGKECNAVLRFDIPFGFNFNADVVPPGVAPTAQLVWVCWYKQTGSQLYAAMSDEKHMSDPDKRNYANYTSLLIPSLYYV